MSKSTIVESVWKRKTKSMSATAFSKWMTAKINQGYRMFPSALVDGGWNLTSDSCTIGYVFVPLNLESSKLNKREAYDSVRVTQHQWW